MYLLDELTKEYQKALVKDAETARKFEVADNDASAQSDWRVKAGDFLIDSGLKLRGRHSKKKHTRASFPIS
jgi:hypothetical protein